MDRNVIYYMGPSPAREERPIGSAGPTTASRMDKYAPNLIDLGLGAMVGKGKRSQAVIDAIVRNGCVYFDAVGGAGALLSKRILSSEIVAYDDLGTEAIRRLEVEDFPVIVVIDSEGNNLYETAIQEYAEKNKNVNIKFDIFSYFYRFAVLHNTQPVLLYIFTFGQHNSKAATSASLSRPLFPFLCKLLYLFLE